MEIVRCWMFFLIHELTDPAEVSLIGPSNVIRGDPLYLNCTSNEIPSGESAEFLLNDETYSTIRHYQNDCFSSLTRSRCQKNECACSTDGRSYYLKINTSNYVDDLKVRCEMKFSVQRKHNSKVIAILDTPEISLGSRKICNRSSSVTLNCTFNGNANDHKAADWQHFRNGNLIRKIKGEQKSNQSLLTIPCSYENAGNYICSVSKKYSNKTYIAEKSIMIIIQGLPEVIIWHQFRNIYTQLCIKFYSNPKPYKTKWFSDNELLLNSDRYHMITLLDNLTSSMKRQNSVSMIYVSNLTINFRPASVYLAVLENDFGITRHEFTVENVEVVFSFYTIIWSTSIVVAIVLAVGITSVCIRGYIPRNSSHSILERHRRGLSPIYYAAPSLNTTNDYDLAVSPYLETEEHGPRNNDEDDKSSESIGSEENNPHYIEIIDV